MIAHHYHSAEALDPTSRGALVGAVHIHQLQGVLLPRCIDCCIAFFLAHGLRTCQLIARQQLLEYMPADQGTA